MKQNYRYVIFILLYTHIACHAHNQYMPLASTLHDICDRIASSNIENHCTLTDEKDEIAIARHPVAYEHANQLRRILQAGTEMPAAYLQEYYRNVYTTSYIIPVVLALEQEKLQHGVITTIFQHRKNYIYRNDSALYKKATNRDITHLYTYVVPMLSPSTFPEWHNTSAEILPATTHQTQHKVYDMLANRSRTKSNTLTSVSDYIQSLRNTLQKSYDT